MDDEHILEEAAAVLKALSDANRMKIFAMLMEGDSCNCELKDRLGLQSNLLSHHLRLLREAGLVSARRDALDGRWIYYAVESETIERWRAWLASFLDTSRKTERAVLCGPEGQQEVIQPAEIALVGTVQSATLSGGIEQG